MKKKQKLIKTTITRNKLRALWVWVNPVDGDIYTSMGNNKYEFIQQVVGIIKRYVMVNGLAFSLEIRDRNNKFHEERTYPRSADPKKSKG